MNFFQLDPQSIAERVNASGKPAHAPTLAQSLLRGIVGFTTVSVAGFLPWVLAGKWDYYHPAEPIMFGSCALVFMVLSGLLLHLLIIGPGSLKRFYIFFSIAFAAYSAAWTAGWMGLHGQYIHVRSIAGLFTGTVVMGIFFAAAFEARAQMLKIIAALFVLNSLGYFTGGWIEGYLAHLPEFKFTGITLSGPALVVFMKLMWGVCYGIGLGAGLGFAFYAAQTNARLLLESQQSKNV